MAELVPIPLGLQLKRALFEYEREGKIFDLPRDKFFHGLPGLDTSVSFHGKKASTPLGPAAGPHDQLLQNIVLCWLGGARIIELKTVQILDELKVPRPCIDAQSVTYNVEWSQELKLEQSLREYVSAAMFLEILQASRLLGDDFPGGETVFDMSVGYNLEGIRSPRMRTWIAGMKDASSIIDELRSGLTGRFRQYRDLPFLSCISDTITLSTFHGCPAEEIEDIVTFLLREMDVNVCVKMNPTLLGREQVQHLLHDVLGYREIKLDDEAFKKDLKLDQALDLLPRLDSVARACGKRLSVKFSNTLVVRNHRSVFADELMYMSGAPLHVLTMNLVREFSERTQSRYPLSFSAGLTANNMANTVAMNFVPVTTCTDLLRPGGYGRLHRYMNNLGARMRQVGATSISEFVMLHAGQGPAAIDVVVRNLVGSLSQLEVGDGTRVAGMWLKETLASQLHSWVKGPCHSLREICAQVNGTFTKLSSSDVPESVRASLSEKLSGLEQALVAEAGLLNTPLMVAHATADPGYRWEQNKGVPRKIGSKLWLYDCINCDKCVPVCPNDANFIYEGTAVEIPYNDYALFSGGGFSAVKGGTFRVKHCHQLANYADACNECGNCEVFCPEDEGPQFAKPRFFGSLETYRKHAGQNGFYIGPENGTRIIHGTFGGKSYVLTEDVQADCARFEDALAQYVIQTSNNALVTWQSKDGSNPVRLDMLPYLQLRYLLEAVSNPRRVHYANVAALQE